MSENNEKKPELEFAQARKKVDEDWKNKVKSEKEKLAAQQSEAKSILTDSEHKIYIEFLQSLFYQTQIFLGLVPNPLTNAQQADLGQAQFYIEVLTALNKKTKETQTSDEKALMGKSLSDLKLVYSQIASQMGNTTE